MRCLGNGRLIPSLQGKAKNSSARLYLLSSRPFGEIKRLAIVQKGKPEREGGGRVLMIDAVVIWENRWTRLYRLVCNHQEKRVVGDWELFADVGGSGGMAASQQPSSSP
jgi:hypothetical protein